MKAAAASEEEEICGRKINQESCSRKFGKWSCKNASADNELGYCQKHYKDYNDLELEKMKLPPDEQRCSKFSGMGWRCKNFRMRSHGGASANDDSVRNSKFCEKHYIYFAEYGKKRKKKKKTIGDGEDDDTSHIQGGSANVGTKRNKKLSPYEQRCGRTASKGWRCKNVRMAHGAAAADDTVPKTIYCEKHYNYHANLKKKRSEDAGSGPDEQRCSKMNGMGWRCKNSRMGHGASVDDDTVL
ncbi:uncharacterized protein LOC113273135 [Papaver somniferum]|uniref:uncharacterized protein LOC113273135 n=1 Tax=Papaver somniferum TaxID=3469 RepID=UPI000E704025|nr:uncharacterized protein LOC113273135 [Papaver somniferum]